MRTSRPCPETVSILEEMVEGIVRGHVPLDYAQHRALLLDLRDFAGRENSHYQVGVAFLLAMAEPREAYLVSLEGLRGESPAGRLAHLAFIKALTLSPDEPLQRYVAAVEGAYGECGGDPDVLNIAINLCLRHDELCLLERRVRNLLASL
jgi:hypothetical protein